MKSLDIARQIEKIEFDLKFYFKQREIAIEERERAKKNKTFFNRKILDALTEKKRLEALQKKYSQGKRLDKIFKK